MLVGRREVFSQEEVRGGLPSIAYGDGPTPVIARYRGTHAYEWRVRGKRVSPRQGAAVPRYFDAANVTETEIGRFIEVGLQACTPALRGALEANDTTPAVPAARLAAVRAPMLVLVSIHDPFGSFDQAVAMSDAFPDSRIGVFSSCGHTPMWEKPFEFAGAVAEFLRRASAGPHGGVQSGPAVAGDGVTDA